MTEHLAIDAVTEILDGLYLGTLRTPGSVEMA
jgi:hypothetical protein